MPKTTAIHKKRHGMHHRHSKKYLRTYLPYLPLVVTLAFCLVLGGFQPQKPKTLAYATNMSINELLAATNTQRGSNSVAGLTLNQRLVNAAQAKANDMVARNYWSHNTPDGQEPWVFFDNAGYQYQKAGENLAYGFATSDDTVAGWMNSSAHRANMLDSTFTEVGFGFANSSNFNNSGPETVVVAEYGEPQTLGVSTSIPPSPPASGSTTLKTAGQQANQASPSPLTPSSNQEIQAAPTASKATPVNTDFPTINALGLQPISQVQTLTAGKAPWVLYAMVLLSSGAILVLLFKHGLALRHVLINSERVVIKHIHQPLFDSLLLSLVILGIVLTRTTGFIG